VLGDQDKRLL